MSFNNISAGATVKVQFGDLSPAQKEQLMLLLAMEPTDDERQQRQESEVEGDDGQHQPTTSLQFRSSSSLEISVLWGPLALAAHPACQILRKELQKALFRVPGHPLSSQPNPSNRTKNSTLDTMTTRGSAANASALEKSFEASSTARLHSDVKRSTSTGRRRRSRSRSPSADGRGNSNSAQGAASNRTPSWSFKLIDEFLAYIVRRGLRTGVRPATNSTATSSALDLFDEFLVDRCGLPNLIRMTSQDIFTATAFFKKVCPLCGIFRKYVCQDVDAVEDLKVALEKAGSDAAGLRLNALLLDMLIFLAHLRQTLWPLQVHETQKVSGQFELDSTFWRNGEVPDTPALLVPRRYVPLKVVPDVVRSELGRYSIGKKVVMHWLQLESEQYLKGASVAFDVKGHVDLFQLCDAMVTAKFVGTTFSKPSQDVVMTPVSKPRSDDITSPKGQGGSAGSGTPARPPTARDPSPQRIAQSPSYVVGKLGSPLGSRQTGTSQTPTSGVQRQSQPIPSVPKARSAQPSDIAKLLALIPEVVDARKQQRAAAAATAMVNTQPQSVGRYSSGVGDAIDIDPALLLEAGDEGGDFFEAPSAIRGTQDDVRGETMSAYSGSSVQGRPGSGQTPTSNHLTSLATVIGPSGGPLARESTGSTPKQLPRDRPPSSTTAGGYSTKYAGYSSATASSTRQSSSRAPDGSGMGSTVSASVSTPRTASGRSRSPSPKPKIIDIVTVAPNVMGNTTANSTVGRMNGGSGSQFNQPFHQGGADPSSSRRSGSTTSGSENQNQTIPPRRESILFPAESSGTAAVAERRSFRTLGTNASEEDVLKYSLRRAAKPTPTSPGIPLSSPAAQSGASLLIDAECVPYQQHRGAEFASAAAPRNQISSALSSRPGMLLSPRPIQQSDAAVVDLSRGGAWQSESRTVIELVGHPLTMAEGVFSPARPNGFPEAPLFPSAESSLQTRLSEIPQSVPPASVLRGSQARPVRVGPATSLGGDRAVGDRVVHFIDDPKDRLLSPSQAHYGLTAREASISSPGLLPSDYQQPQRNDRPEHRRALSPPSADTHRHSYSHYVDEASESIPAELALEGGLSGRTAQLRFDQPLTSRFSGSTSSEGRQSTGSAVNTLQSPPRNSANIAGSGRASGSLATYPRSPAVLGEEEEALMRQLEESLMSHRRPLHLDPESAFSTRVLSPPRTTGTGHGAARTRLEQLAYAD